jgi:hypothetical protein
MKKKELLKRIKALEDQVSELQFLKCSWTYSGHPVSKLAAWEIQQQHH